MKKAAFLFFRVEVGNAACAVQYLVVVQTMLVRCPKNLDFTVFQKVSLSNLIFEQTAQAILDARNLYPDCSLADLYDEATMPPELRKAHQQNDKAVMQAYGFWGKLNSESACVAELMKMYQKLTEG